MSDAEGILFMSSATRWTHDDGEVCATRLTYALECLYLREDTGASIVLCA